MKIIEVKHNGEMGARLTVRDENVALACRMLRIVNAKRPADDMCTIEVFDVDTIEDTKTYISEVK